MKGAIVWSVAPCAIFDDIKKATLDKYEDKALELYNAIIAASPVDSGRYRANHIMTVGASDYSHSQSTAARSYQKGFYGAKDFANVVIQNNLPYAYRIEHGWSRQAPTGVYALSVQRVF